jgi:DNA-directed RNA polymerase subunit beta'
MPTSNKVQTFGQYLVNKALPPGIEVTSPVTSNVLKDVLTKVYRNYPDKYDDVVTALKSLGDRFSTFEGVTFGIKEIEVPNKPMRDKLVSEYTKKLDKVHDYEGKVKVLGELQTKIVDMDKSESENKKDDSASMMVYQSGAIGKKKNQLVKLRTTPVVVSGKDGNIVPEIFPTSYAEGQDPFHHWLQTVESRNNVVLGKTQTASPGELSKIIHNVVAESVVSVEDCGTKHGVPLSVSDDIIGRYVPFMQQGIGPDTPITEDMRKKLVHDHVSTIVVRSPQTCQAKGNTVCAKCMGLGISSLKPFNIGEHAGFISAGNLAEPLTQMILSSKHSTSMAKLDTSLRGDSGFRQFVNMPKEYPNRKIYCEVFGKVYRTEPLPQGGYNLVIQTSGHTAVPSRFIEHGFVNEKLGKNYINYYIPPVRKTLQNIKPGAEVYPGMPLTDGVDNLQDIARLKGIGLTRSAAAEGMRNIYKSTGVDLDRRHFELLARAGHNYVKIEKAPPGFMYHRGETISYPEFLKAIERVPGQTLPIDESLGKTMLEQLYDVTAGTFITPDVVSHLKKLGVDSVKCTNALEISAVVVPLQRVVNLSKEWLPKLNYRYLKQTLVEGASEGAKTDIHSHNPYTAYSVGNEVKHGPDGSY